MYRINAFRNGNRKLSKQVKKAIVRILTKTISYN